MGLDLCVALAGGIVGLEFAHCFAYSELDYVLYCGLGACVLLRMFDVGLRAVLLAWRLRITSHVRRWITCGIASLALAYCFACPALACGRYCGLGARVLLRMFGVGLRAFGALYIPSSCAHHSVRLPNTAFCLAHENPDTLPAHIHTHFFTGLPAKSRILSAVLSICGGILCADMV